MRRGRRRVALVGLDSITPGMIGRFIEEGRMPNLARLRERGWWSEVVPTMPATTPAGWTTVASGAWPSTHGIEGFAVHREGDPLDRKTHTCGSEHIRADLIWQAAERVGLDTILLKYPMSWPPRGGDRVTQVDGAGGWGGLKCVWDLLHSGCWDTAARAAGPGDAVRSEWMTRDQDNLDEEAAQRIEVLGAEPEGWANLPPGAVPAWEGRLELRASGARSGVELHLLALRLSGEDRVLIAPARDAAQGHLVPEGGWSGWLRLGLPDAGGALRHGHLRFKVTALDLAARRLRLYQTQMHREDGYTRPAGLAAELLQSCGPFVEWTESYDLLQGWIDDATQLEVYEQHVEWMSRASAHLLSSRPWDLFMTQVHFVDMAYHVYWGAIAPEHPQHDAGRAAAYWELLGRVHELADRFVGAVAEQLGPEDVLLVAGDHGHDLYHTNFLANHLLVREGLQALYRDPRTGQPRIDWKRTQAYASSYRVYVNLAGRDPDGVVPPARFHEVQERIVEALYGARDPRTGRSPVRLALRREDARSLGLYGPTMGDVVFAMAPGYQTRSTTSAGASAWAGNRLRPDALPLFKQTELFREFTGEHDTALFLTDSIRTLLFMAGEGIPPGHPEVPVPLVDLAPTMCDLLGIPPPRQCEGASLLHLASREAQGSPALAEAGATTRQGGGA